MNYLTALDIVFLLVILLCAGDALRQLHPFTHPIRSIAFGLVTIGSFGWIGHDVEGNPIQWWALSLHTGFAIYAVLLFRARSMTRRKADGIPRHSFRRIA